MKRLLLSLICSSFFLCGCHPINAFNKFQINTAHEKCSSNGGIEGLYHDADVMDELKRYWVQCSNEAIFYLPKEPTEANKIE